MKNTNEQIETLPEVAIDCTAKHTPGPWLFGQSPTQKEYGQWTIGLSYGWPEIPISGCRDGEYLSLSGYCNESDARLISSAPDLLAALEELVTGHSMKGEEMARAAIKKARGAK